MEQRAPQIATVAHEGRPSVAVLSRGWIRRWRTVPLRPMALGRAAWISIVVCFLASRVAVLGFEVLGALLFPQVGPHLSLAVQPIGTPGGGDWSRLFDHFDTGFYLGIAERYATPSDGWAGWLGEWAFFPLYPMAIHQVAQGLALLQVAGNRNLIAGVIVSYVAFFAALVYLYRLTAAEISSAAARRAILFLAIFPASIFFSVAYSESLFLLCCVAAFYYARRRMWPLAGAFCAAATLTHPQGLLLLVPLGVEFASYWIEQGGRLTARTIQIAWLGLPLVALGGYALYSHAITGYWLAFSVSETQVWGHHLTPPIYPLLHFIIAPSWSGFLSYDFQPTNFLLAVLLLGLVVIAWRRLPSTYAIWLLIAVLFPLSSNGQHLFAFARFAATAFPAFVALAAWSLGQQSAERRADGSVILARTYFPPLRLRLPLIVVVSVPLLALYAVLWVNNYPAGT